MGNVICTVPYRCKLMKLLHKSVGWVLLNKYVATINTFTIHVMYHNLQLLVVSSCVGG